MIIIVNINCFQFAQPAGDGGEVVIALKDPGAGSIMRREMEDRQATRGGFAAFLYSQFCAAFNDNILRSVVGVYLAYEAFSKADSNDLQAFVSAAFMLPFVILSPLAGSLADRFNKRSVLIVAKWFELVPTAVAVLSCLLDPPFRYLGLVAAVFLMEVQSSFFSPSKYGWLPEIVPEHRLARANGILEMLTMIAIIGGQATGAILLPWVGIQNSAWACLGVAFVGSLAAVWIPRGREGDPSRGVRFNPVAQVWATFQDMRRTPALRTMVFALSVFWLVSALFAMNMPVFGRFVLNVGERESGMLLAILSLGIGVGAILAGTARSPQASLGLVPPSAVGIGVASIAIWLYGTTFTVTAILLGILGFFGGLYLVPQNTVYQARSPVERRGAYMATLNFVSFTFMVLASLIFKLMTEESYLGLGNETVFLAIGAGVLTVGIIQCIASPELVAAMIVSVATRLIYRVRVIGVDRIPAQGGVLIAPNHISLVDALFLMVSSPRPLRFVIDENWYRRPFLHRIFRALKLIPIKGGAGSRGALQAAQDALQAGEAVVIFPEGELSRTGSIQRFRPGIEKLARESGAPILPVHLDRLWGSIFSFQGGRAIWKMPRQIPYPVTVSYGELLPSDSAAFQVRQAVSLLSVEAFGRRLAEREPLGVEFVRQAKRAPFRRAISDSLGARLTYMSTLIRSAILSRVIRELCRGQDRVGILLPPTATGAVCNVAAQLAGKVSVNLNWTASQEAFDIAIRRSELGVILTSRGFIEKLGLPARPEYLFLEDLAPRIGALRKLLWSAACFLLTTTPLIRLLCDRQSIDEDATIIFSSGSTGIPKGVRLTHANVLSNVLAIPDVFPLSRRDTILGTLPFFHSFGFTVTIWMPLLGGFGVAYHPNPLDGRGVGKRVRESRATMLTATPSFLQIYTRQCEPEDLKTLRHVVVGAEKLQAPMAEAFQAKFGVVPREGYGCTELSPVVALNSPDADGPGVRQVGTRRGTIGRSLPGVAVKVVDPDTLRELGPDQDGLLLVKGSNVMAGYLGEPEKTAEVIRDGWYVTGDIGRLDLDGFITLTDRLSRFSKLGGEMVPHVKVEEAIQEASGQSERCVVVTSVPDAEKGERLVVLHTHEIRPSDLNARLREMGLPALWIPKPNSYHKIERIPLLGSGKVDLAAAKLSAKALSSDSGRPAGDSAPGESMSKPQLDGSHGG
jgi:acyl-[acyl-carrier-protein]-phospholipid O-acyltransferase/long-chain-fatty-acid--[acyl-carrier-protein] ligase